MTDNEIIKALECCSQRSGHTCSKCPYHDCNDECVEKRNADIVDLINRQQQEIRQLQLKLDDCECDIIPKLKYSLERANKYGAETDAENIQLLKENERLQGEIKEKTETIVFLKDQATGWSIDFCNLKNKLETAKAKAIKDFAERLKENEFFANFTYKGEARLIIDNLVKEMIGEQDESIQQEDC